MPHHRQVMRHHHIGERMFLPQVGQQIKDLGLHGHIQRRGRLVQQQQARLGGQRPGNGDALALSARELVRIAKAELLPEAHVIEQLGHTPVDLAETVQMQGLAQHLIDRMARVQRGVRVLKHHLHGLVEALEPALGDLRAVDADLARPVRGEPGDRAQDGGFARTAFADEAKAFALRHAETGAFHRVDTVAGGAEPYVQPVDLQHAHVRPLTLGASDQAGSRCSTSSRSRGASRRGSEFRRPRV